MVKDEFDASPVLGARPAWVVPLGISAVAFFFRLFIGHVYTELGGDAREYTAIAKNLAQFLDGRPTTNEATWNAFCLADFGDGGVAFVAQPQIPPRNVNWSASGKWVHLAKAGFEKYFLGKIKRGESEPFYEKLALDVMGLKKIKG